MIKRPINPMNVETKDEIVAAIEIAQEIMESGTEKARGCIGYLTLFHLRTRKTCVLHFSLENDIFVANASKELNLDWGTKSGGYSDPHIVATHAMVFMSV